MRPRLRLFRCVHDYRLRRARGHALPLSELTNPWEPWQRLIDSIGSYYRGRLFKARDQAKTELGELDEEELRAAASEGRRIASPMDEEDARYVGLMATAASPPSSSRAEAAEPAVWAEHH
jgi:hypothetical protein